MPQIVVDGRAGRQHRLPKPPLDRVHRAAGDGGQRRLGAAPSPRRRPARRRALGGVRRERRAVRDGDPAAGSAAAGLPLASHPDRGRPRRGGQGRPLVRDQHRHPRAEAGRGVVPLPGRGERRPGGRGGLRKHVAEGGEPGRPVLRRLVRRGRGGRGREPAAAGGRPPGPRQGRASRTS